ncbi:epsin-2-like [Nilaparvata lugens]|uniref:epsin-2-like n=1 Tax=Nilaparvata lugens TaxID=108931 RepID=UPI00193CBCAC|nr:epsin-2-like [Nilaparvata lugens]
MDYSAIFILAALSLLATIQAEESNGHAVGNIQSNHPPPIKLDPKLRRALLRVLTKLEEEEKQNKDYDFDKMPMGNIVTEEDFINYFNSKDAQTQLFDATSKEDDQVIKIDQNYKRAPGEQLKFSLYDPSGEKHNPEEILNGPFVEKYKNQEVDEMRMKEVEELSERVKFVSTEPSPQDAIFFQIPHPIEIPNTSNLDSTKFSFTNDSLNAQETRNIVASQTESVKVDEKVKEEAVAENEVAGNVGDDNDEEEVEDEKPSGNSTKPEKHEVEFFGAPLLAAFTVQQDQQGLPRRVIPLDYRSNGGEPIPLPTIKEQEEQEAKERELQEKQRILEQQLLEQRERLRLLQQQQFQPQQVFGNSENSQFRFSDNEHRNSPQYYEQLRSQQQILLANQQRQQLAVTQQGEQQRLSLLEQARQKQQTILLSPQQRQQEEQERILALREQERLRLLRKEEELRNQQGFNFQRSVDFQFRPSQPLPNQFGSNNVSPFNQFQPSAELNRVNRGESNRFVGNLGFNNVIPTPAPTPDAQLQNLLFRSGVTGEIKTTGQQEDLNIVSKVLALNHGAQLQQFQNPQQSFVSQQSNNNQQFVQQQPQNPPQQNFVQQQPNGLQFQNFVQQQPSVAQNFVQQQSNQQSFVQQQPSVSQSFVQQQPSVSLNFVQQQPSVSQNFVQQQPSVSQNFVQQQQSVSQNFVQQQQPRDSQILYSNQVSHRTLFNSLALHKTLLNSLKTLHNLRTLFNNLNHNNSFNNHSSHLKTTSYNNHKTLCKILNTLHSHYKLNNRPLCNSTKTLLNHPQILSNPFNRTCYNRLQISRMKYLGRGKS